MASNVIVKSINPLLTYVQTGWYGILAGTFTPRQQAFTNDPATGAVTLSMTDTSNFEVGDIVNVSSSAGNENVAITSVVANTSIGVTVALNHTTTSRLVRHATTNKTFVLVTSVDQTAYVGVGDRIKLTDSTTKYFIVVAITSTKITLYGGTDYSIASASAVTSVYVSHQKAPVGFNTSPAKWTETYTDTTNYTKTTTGYASAYSLTAPIGAWNMLFLGRIAISRASTTSTYGRFGVSTSATSAIGTNIYNETYLGSASGSLQISYLFTHTGFVTTTVKTVFYAIYASPDNTSSIRYNGALGENAKNLLSVTCAYL